MKRNKLFMLLALLSIAATSMAQVTFTGIASNNRFANREGHKELLDGDLDTKWEAYSSVYYVGSNYYIYNDDNGNVVFQASEAIYVNGLTLITGGDTQSYPNRNPYEWIIYGSNDDAAITAATAETPNYAHSSWKVIAHINNCQMPALNKTAKSYKFNPSQTAYKYFKFHVKRLVGMDELQLAELALDYTTTVISPVTHIASGSGHYGSESADKLFDGSAETKWCKGNNVSTNWVVFSTTKPICASSYTIQNSNDAEGRDPNKFKLYGASGSNAPTTDGSTEGWTLIDTEDNAKSVLTTDHFAYAHFTMDNPGIYKFFMLKVEETRNASDGNFQMSEFVLDEYDQFAEEYTQISSDAEMSSFATQVNSGNTTLKAVLLADVNSSTPIGTESNKFAGEIDGMGHKVNLNIDASSNYQGFVGYATGGATIKNLILTGSVKNTANKTGGFIAEVKGSGTITITNCGNEAKIEGAGGETAAIVANNWGGSCTLNITNVYNIGEVSGTGDVASICAYCGNGSSVFLNVYNSGTVTGDSGGKFVRYSSGTYTNCYCVGKTSNDKGDVIDASAADVTSGKLCYKLNGRVDNGTTWTQTIGTDTHPVLFFAGQPVRHASTDCATNLNVSGGNVQLGSVSDMIQFSAEVAAGNTAMNGSVTTNIDMSAGGYSPIGTTASKYNGTFDGQGHIITLNISSDQEYQGLIGCATGGANIKNVTTRGSVSGSARCGGILGGSQGSGEISITNCGNEANITTTGVNAGGVHGCNNGSGVTYTLTNCYNTGTVRGSNESAGLSGWLGNNATVTNCYNIGDVTGVDGSNRTFARWGSGTYTNCYNKLNAGSVDGRIDNYSMDKVRSGELCVALGDDFHQVLGTDNYPVLDSSKPNVYKMTVGNAGWASFVPDVNIATLPTGVTAYVGQDNTTYLHLEEVTELPADNAFVVKATEGDYYYNNTNESITLTETNDLAFFATDTAADGTQYCLANGASGVGFYKVNNGVTIPARKVYLSVPASVKAFYGFDEDDATGLDAVNGEGFMVNGPIYNLAGQRVNKMQKGINIVNGKKVMVK